MRRTRQRGPSNAVVGLLVLVALAAIIYVGLAKGLPFGHHHEVRAVFTSANGVAPGSPVRIAGVDVGKVSKVEHVPGGRAAAVVTLRIDKRGLPLHRDAHAAIRPRIFLEGNFFVDLQPGSPSAPELGDGGTIPINQTSAPVQLDQVLTALQSDTRRQIQLLLDQYSTGSRPTATARSSPTPSRARTRTTCPATSGTPAPSPARWTATPPSCRTSSPTSIARRGRSPPTTSRCARRSRSSPPR
jgi:ABC-type transporter Mla subunit MlaD